MSLHPQKGDYNTDVSYNKMLTVQYSVVGYNAVILRILEHADLIILKKELIVTDMSSLRYTHPTTSRMYQLSRILEPTIASNRFF